MKRKAGHDNDDCNERPLQVQKAPQRHPPTEFWQQLQSKISAADNHHYCSSYDEDKQDIQWTHVYVQYLDIVVAVIVGVAIVMIIIITISIIFRRSKKQMLMLGVYVVGGAVQLHRNSAYVFVKQDHCPR